MFCRMMTNWLVQKFQVRDLQAKYLESSPAVLSGVQIMEVPKCKLRKMGVFRQARQDNCEGNMINALHGLQGHPHYGSAAA